MLFYCFSVTLLKGILSHVIVAGIMFHTFLSTQVAGPVSVKSLQGIRAVLRDVRAFRGGRLTGVWVWVMKKGRTQIS